MKVGSEVPLYYPEDFKHNYINLANMEFSIKNEYYNDEVSLFIKNISTIIAEYKYNKSNKDVISFEISKNNEIYNYSLYPIYFDIPGVSDPIHMLTIVYVNPHEKGYQIEYLYSTICISGVYLMMGFFLILLSKYLITSIAKSIVRPIKIIKDLLEQNLDDTNINYLEEKEAYNKNNDIKFNEEKRKMAKKGDFINFSNIMNKENEIDDGKIETTLDTFNRKESFLMPDINGTNNFLGEKNTVMERDGNKKI